jgi:16S rRNA (guanine527-N7)-methyltransferase
VSLDPAASLIPASRRSLEIVLELLAQERASVSSVVDKRAWQVHVVDSLTGLEVAELRSASRIADIGAGAGFPGLVLAAALPAAEVDLIESVSRKTAFIAAAAVAAGILNAHAVTARSEDVAREEPPTGGRGSYDVVTARAVGRLSTLAELASPLLKESGVLIAWKGRRDADEEAQMDRAAASLAMTPESILDVGHRAGSEHRHLHVIRKSGPTPAGLPRKSGLAKKRPPG